MDEREQDAARKYLDANLIKTFDMRELHGKTLQIVATSADNLTFVVGRDAKDGKVYVLYGGPHQVVHAGYEKESK